MKDGAERSRLPPRNLRCPLLGRILRRSAADDTLTIMNEKSRRRAGLGPVVPATGLLVLGLGLSAVLSPSVAAACDTCGGKKKKTDGTKAPT